MPSTVPSSRLASFKSGEGAHSLEATEQGGRLVVAPDKPSSLENCIASGPLQGRELQGRTLVVSRYAGIAVFHGLIMALTLDPCKPLKTRRGGRGSKLTLCGPWLSMSSCGLVGIPLTLAKETCHPKRGSS
jgi:hypothetical protein